MREGLVFVRASVNRLLKQLVRLASYAEPRNQLCKDTAQT